MTFIFSLLLVIGLVVLVHELGHFLAAKIVGIRVERFSLGFPPKIIGKQIGETEYCLSWIPIGGYVKMAGMIDEGSNGDSTLTGAPWEFMSKSAPAKILALAGGVILNFIFAYLLFTAIIAFSPIGVSSEEPVIAEVLEGYPAAAAGLQSGDRVLEVNGSPIFTWTELGDRLRNDPGRANHVVVSRNNERIELDLFMKSVDGGEALIGIAPVISLRSPTVPEIITGGWGATARSFGLIGTSLKLLVTGKASVKDLSGPVAIAKMSAEAAKSGLVTLMAFIAFISINIGCINLLPLPALDGGHILVTLWEGLTRRPLSTRVRIGIQQVGLVMILALSIFALVNDITK
ncbi:MAG: RIP metalloprotease RseP [Candidatus Eisenbacteria bacterium]|nr:RIP metalloprotease RseP [Candidatus Eisenbacteria bacterium]MBU1950549.1 RIP metalloprotease RseP [Candidatus Eisenbacteria bacterium]